ncbi:MAG: NorD protein, partial [Bacteroidetes bacterium]|nr:NorD protein [Bacteroidota bacterium]
MEIDEIIYSKVLRFFKNRKENNAEVLNRKVLLSDLKPRLTLIARAICGTAIEIFPAEREGGFKNDNFFLPISVALFQSKEENIQFYIFRTIYLCVQKQLEFNWTETIYSEELSSVKAIETAPDVLKKMFEDYPSLQDNFEVLFNQLPIDKKTQKPDVYWLYGKWMKNTQEENNADKLQNFDNQANQLINKIEAKTTLHTKAVEEIESLTIDKKQQEDYVLMHSFEKIETAEEFNGNWRDFDGEDDLKDHQEALEEMNMKFTVRVDDTVHSVYQADFVENTSVSESSEIDEKG